MSDKKLAVLGILAVLVAGAAVLQSRLGTRDRTVDFSTSPLIEGLAIDAVAAIRVTGSDDSQTVHLKRQNDQFVVTGKDNYLADATKINRLINQCLDIRTVETVTDNPENHADLQVTEETANGRVAFLDAEEVPIVTVVLSAPDPESGSAYARLQSQDQVYRVNNAPLFNTRPMDYIDTELLSVQRDQISSVAVKTPGDTYTLTSPEGSDAITLQNMPAGKQFKDTVYSTVFGALSSLRFDDVMSMQNVPEDLAFDAAYNARLYDLTVYKLSIAQKDDQTYVKAVADFLDKSPVEKTVGEVESDEELKKKEAKLLAIDAVKEFNARHEDWVYRIPSYKAEQLVKPLAELLEDIPQPEPADPNQPPTDAPGAEE